MGLNKYHEGDCTSSTVALYQKSIKFLNSSTDIGLSGYFNLWDILRFISTTWLWLAEKDCGCRKKIIFRQMHNRKLCVCVCVCVWCVLGGGGGGCSISTKMYDVFTKILQGSDTASGAFLHKRYSKICDLNLGLIYLRKVLKNSFLNLNFSKDIFQGFWWQLLQQ